MAAPIRTQIRNAFAGGVVAGSNLATTGALVGLATTGAGVYVGRYLPVKTAKLPCLFVRLATQQSRGLESMGLPRDQTIATTLSVIAAAKSEADVDALLDQIDMEVRMAAYAAFRGALAGIVKRVDYEGITEYGEDDDNEDIAAAQMDFSIEYVSPENAPDQPL